MMRKRTALQKTLLFSKAVLIAALLSGCATYSGKDLPESRATLPPIPPDLETCLQRQTPLPKGAWDRIVTLEVLARLIVSEKNKSECARQLRRFYDNLREGLGP
jgi:hypothetical protein